MRSWELIRACVVQGRCPLCREGALFSGWLRMHAACPSCGLDFDQWAGEWITPTYIASTVGMLVAVALSVAILVSGIGLRGPVPPEVPVALLSGAVALAVLRPAKAFWLAFLYGIGGIEVSADTRARLRWRGDADAQRLGEAERYARRVRPPAPAPAGLTVRRFSSLRELLFPRVRLRPGTPPRRPDGSRSGRAPERAARPPDA